MNGVSWIRSFLICATVVGLCVSTEAGEFFIRDGERVAFLGDSITEQGKPGETDRGGLYTVYIESYVLTRFPTWKLDFRNFGIGGDSAALIQRQSEPIDWATLRSGDDTLRKPKIEAYVAHGLNRDVLPWQPTLVTIQFGMNDFGYQNFNDASYRRFMLAENALVKTLRDRNCRVALFTPQPIEHTPDKPNPNEEGSNTALRKFADGLKEVATQQKVLFVDHFDPYMTLVRQARAATPPEYFGGGRDAVHPGAPGHAVMAWVILKELGAGSEVSAAEIDAAENRVVATSKCRIKELVKQADGTIRFERIDDALPMPIDARAEPALKRATILADLNRYLLKVTGLEAARYEVLIDGEMAATVDSGELQQGWNMATAKGPITAQSQQVMQLVLKKNAIVFRRWQELLTQTDPRLTELESQLRHARLPRAHQFTLKPVAHVNK
ncbi:MAG: SGNH/GDSL hydrolase family protein [Planctomycetia bacterium]|nr:SGNH/GDSL hydrolase family protein [Planctomycetia bacterium]